MPISLYFWWIYFITICLLEHVATICNYCENTFLFTTSHIRILNKTLSSEQMNKTLAIFKCLHVFAHKNRCMTNYHRNLLMNRCSFCFKLEFDSSTIPFRLIWMFICLYHLHIILLPFNWAFWASFSILITNYFEMEFFDQEIAFEYMIHYCKMIDMIVTCNSEYVSISEQFQVSVWKFHLSLLMLHQD